MAKETLNFPTYGNPSNSGGSATYPPTGLPTYNSFLFQSLGSFFSQIFQARLTLTGYTTGEAEELIQAYQNLANAVYSLSIYNIPTFSKEIWYPLILQKSLLNQSPFVFQPNGAVFGSQPSTSEFYANQIFKFGYPKSTTGNIYSYTPAITIGEFSVFSNNPFTPTSFYLQNVDVQLQNGVLYFNKNPFNDPSIVVTPIINANGVPATFVDQNGVTQPDSLITLWGMNLDEDTNNILNNFGYVFGINQPSSEQYKQLLQGFFNLAVEGATFLAFKSLLSYIGGIVPVINPVETVQYVATTEYNVVVVTDKNSYLYPLGTTLISSCVPGAVFHAGSTFSNLYEVYDSVKMKNWWLTVFPYKTNAALPSNLFVGTYQNALLFNNSLQLLSVGKNGVINFPVGGTTQDIATFEAYLNEPDNAASILSTFNLSAGQSTPLNPLDFIFSNFLQNNTTCVVLNFTTPDQAELFMTLFDEVKEYLPPYVVILMLVNVNVGTDIYQELNNSITIPQVTGLLNADGSNSVGNIASASPYYYNSLTRQFVLSQSPVNYLGDLLSLNNTQLGFCNRTSGLEGTYINDGALFTYIPSGATTINTPLIKFISFPGTITAFTGVLDYLSVRSNSAYSLRKLVSSYTGYALRVRRSSDNTTIDVGLLSNGNLDTTTLLNFCGSGNGFVSIWYDQSGNGNHATQSTNANQPQIVTSGVVNLQNGLPAIRFSGVSTYLNTVQFAVPSTNWAFNAVSETDSPNIFQSLFGDSSGSGVDGIFSIFSNEYGTPYFQFNPSGQVNAPTSIIANASYISTLTYIAGNASNYLNGAPGTSGALSFIRGTVTPTLGYYSGQNIGLNGTIQEAITFKNTTLSTTDRQILEYNQNTYYFNGPLDTLSVSANSAYSLRRLTKNWTGYLIDVRRDSDNTVRSIGFTLGNVLDQAALLAFVGSGNGYISKWYDQSGNSNHATQSTNANQPQIVASGVVNLQGGLPAVAFNSGGTNSLNIFKFDSPTNSWSWNGVYSSNNITLPGIFYPATGAFVNGLLARGVTNLAYTPDVIFFSSGGVIGLLTTTQTSALGQQFIETVTYQPAGNAQLFIYGTLAYTESAPVYPNNTSGYLINNLSGSVQELISFGSNLGTTDRQSLEHSQESFYSIAGS